MEFRELVAVVVVFGLILVTVVIVGFISLLQSSCVQQMEHLLSPLDSPSSMQPSLHVLVHPFRLEKTCLSSV